MSRHNALGFRAQLACGVALIALDIGIAHAQTAPTPPQTAQTPLEEIVVTATRIIRDGYEAPTPTTVLGAEQLQMSAQPNIVTTLTQLPSMVGGDTTSRAN